ncbi:MAG: tRNA pseudouridine(55) synthase TruB [Betaproteobacteria bacterium]|jgi:tRNA pseudouridine55 synthase|nr:tRNA pseudouridine(55) synthase TruB [Betaproteobacteria bacterium]
MSSRNAKTKRAVDGVLLLDKPAGVSSNRALQAARRRYCAVKAGHTGTLDPLATGLLVVLFGEATKFSAALLGADKIYDATVRLGVTTSTGDAEGKILANREPEVSSESVNRVVASFVGEIEQVPPLYSALKKDGKAYYAYARAGQEVDRRARKIVVHRLGIRSFDGRDIVLEAHVGTGTYLRTLAEDIGTRLGCGAHLAALRRTQVGPFQLADAIALAELEAMGADVLAKALRPVDALLGNLPQVDLADEATRRFLQGQAVGLPAPDASGQVRVYGPGAMFLGRGRATDGLLYPERLLAGVARGKDSDPPCGTP